MESTSSADEYAILRIANEVLEQLNISSYRPVSVSWAEDLPITMVDSEHVVPEAVGFVKRDVPIGWCVFSWDRIILPVAMKARFEAEEWRPLLVSSLYYETKLRLRRYLGTIFVLTPLIIDAIGWWELLVVSTPVLGIPVLLLILDLIGLIAALVLTGLLAKWVSWSLRLKADTLAAEYLGKQSLEGVLQKMATLGLVDPYAGIDWWGTGYPFSGEFMSGRPALAERITNLSKFSNAFVSVAG
jgi:hypothetical protein